MKKQTVEIKLVSRNGVYKVNLKVLDGVRVVDKDNASSKKYTHLFEYIDAYIEKNNVTNISMKRGILEDALTKFLKKKAEERAETKRNTVAPKIVKGVDINTLTEEGRELVSDMTIFEMCVEETVKADDFESMFYQGAHYLNARADLYELEALLADSFNVTVEVPLEKRDAVIDAYLNVYEEIVLMSGLEPIVMTKYKRVVIFKNDDYKLTVLFKEDGA